MNESFTDLVQAVFDCDFEGAKRCLLEGASPNETWGSLSVLTHAALAHHPGIFKLLLDSGAEVPDTFLSDVISWELDDWILDSKDDVNDLITILQMVRPTKAWTTIEHRRELAKRLDGCKLSEIVTTLTDDE